MQTGPIVRVADVHSGTGPDRLKALQDLDRFGVVSADGLDNIVSIVIRKFGGH